jgi:hypothetical protein
MSASDHFRAVREALQKIRLPAGAVAETDRIRARLHDDLRALGVDPDAEAARETIAYVGDCAAALMLQAFPTLTPEDVSAFLGLFWTTLLSP